MLKAIAYGLIFIFFMWLSNIICSVIDGDWRAAETQSFKKKDKYIYPTETYVEWEGETAIFEHSNQKENKCLN